MSNTKVAGRFAFAGFLISVSFFSFWLLEDRFNFFNLPTAEQAAAMTGNYNQPKLRAFLETLNFALCPPYIATSFVGMDLGWAANFILWGISLVLNTALYFLLGLGFGALWNFRARHRS